MLVKVPCRYLVGTRAYAYDIASKIIIDGEIETICEKGSCLRIIPGSGALGYWANGSGLVLHHYESLID